jgi:hypothetical protein
MKHLKKFNESIQKDILDNFSYIIDNLGDPKIDRQKWGNEDKWTFYWDLGLDLTKMNEASKVIEKLNAIVSELEDIISAKERLENYYFQLSLTNKLKVDVIPKETGSEDYDFITGQNQREVKINIIDIERCLASKGIRVTKVHLEYNDISEMSSIDIQYDGYEYNKFKEFLDLFMSQLNIAHETDKIDRDIDISYGSTQMEIFPLEEKTYVSY